MKLKFNIVSLAVSLSLASVITITNAATSTDNNANMQQLIARTEMLQQQLDDLKRQMGAAKRSAGKKSKRRKPVSSDHPLIAKHNVEFNGGENLENHGVAKPLKPVGADESTPAWIYTEGSPLTSSPYIGVHSEFDASDLIVSYSSINEDLRLLQQHQRLEDRMTAAGLTEPQHPLLVVSGKLEGWTFYSKPYIGSSVSDIDLATGELDVAAEMNPWVAGFLGIDYDNTSPMANVSSRRIANSRLFLNKGFITIGNLNHAPVWFSVGQLFVPFGRYTSSMINAPLTLALARTNSRSLLLGYHQTDATSPYAEIFAFRGDSRTNSNSRINNYGGDFGYNYSGSNLSTDLGIGYLANLADSDGMQSTGGTFAGFANPPSTNEMLVHRVPAIDVHGKLGAGDFIFLGEYVTASRRFDPSNLTFNGIGARPTALNIEGAYNFHVCDGKPASFALGYGQTSQALALNLPRQRYIGALNVSFWRDTIESLEFRHEINYRSTDTASGNNGTVISAANTPTVGLGKSSDTLTAQVGIYF